jgi:serine/threonine-protein kinase
MAELASGTLVDGRYRVVSRLGSGGMADVFLAEDEQLGRKVALKLLHRRFAEDPGFVERFRREAQSAAGLQHPNVVSVYDRGAYDGTYYIAMEYLPGRSLKQLIREEAPLDPVRAIDLTIQILKAGRFAHRHGVIHRDLKPHNVIVDDTDHAKVTDFGIARAGASDMTETGSIMGTAQYLSPEQAQGHAVSASSDLYSIAVVLYEMLTGHVPFDAESAVTIALKHVSEPPTAPTRINPAVPQELEQVVMWALNKNPADRPQDADQFIAALEAARAAIVAGTRGQKTASMAAVAAVGVPVAGAALAAADGGNVAAASPSQVPMPPYPVTPVDSPAAEGPPPGPPPAQRRRRDPWAWVALVLALLLVGAGVAAYLLTRHTKVTVPAVVGWQLNNARTVLQDRGFSVGVLSVSGAKPAQTVIGENPPGGTQANKGSTVTLTVSSGPGNTTVPPVVGLPLAQAESQIRSQQLEVGRIAQQPSSQYAAGVVINTDPTAGQSPPVGTRVTLFVSTGPAKVTVPDVTGESEGQAKSDLHNAGFQAATTTQTSTTATAGNVITQTPSGGLQAVPGSTVTIVVAQAPTTASVPNVREQTAAAATSALQAAGFKVAQTTKSVIHQQRNGIVLSQSPGGGATAMKGSTVTITVGKYTAPTPTTPTTRNHAHHAHDPDHTRDDHDRTVKALSVAVLGGGRSSEHEVSLASAESISAGLREAGHKPLEIRVGRDGVWRRDGVEVPVVPGRGLEGADVVFPALHGPFGEDGTVQGLLECLAVPYVGAGVLASALCMDKVMFKELMVRAGTPQVEYRAVRSDELVGDRESVRKRLAQLGMPVFVKPARLGSSVGISRVAADDQLLAALEEAFVHDPLAIIEAAAGGLEVECSVIGNGDPVASQPGEILLPGGESGWYDYDAKYTPGAMRLIVPARIPSHVRERVRELALAVYRTVDCRGLARVDFFVDGERVLVNELNTMPGFTSTSVFASLFEADGIPYPALLDRLLELALERHAEAQRHRY